MTRLSCIAGACIVVVVLIAAQATAEAAAIGVCENTAAPSGPDTDPASNGSCAKTVTLTGNQLTIELTNTTPILFGGFLTADAFFLPVGIDASLFSTTNAAFTLSQNPTVNPFDNQGFAFNWLLSINGDWEGGGDPSGGIPAGGSATFVLTLLGDLTGLTESDILNSQAIRFRGFVQGGSDKDLVTGGSDPLPEPGMLLLLAAGGALAAARRQRVV